MSNISDVRRSLAVVRKAWEEQTPSAPVHLTDRIGDASTFAEFCFEFIASHHRKKKSLRDAPS